MITFYILSKKALKKPTLFNRIISVLNKLKNQPNAVHNATVIHYFSGEKKLFHSIEGIGFEEKSLEEYMQEQKKHSHSLTVFKVEDYSKEEVESLIEFVKKYRNKYDMKGAIDSANASISAPIELFLKNDRNKFYCTELVVWLLLNLEYKKVQSQLGHKILTQQEFILNEEYQQSKLIKEMIKFSQNLYLINRFGIKFYKYKQPETIDKLCGFFNPGNLEKLCIQVGLDGYNILS